MTKYQAYLSKRRFSSLDGLRAISILGVIWTHAAPKWLNTRIIETGTYGVTLFFAISGFLITTLLLRERSRNGQIDLNAFYIRRTLRILPLYYGVLLLYIIIVGGFEKDLVAKAGFFHNLLYFATYTSNLFVPLNGRVIFYFAWSLAAEEQFYLAWPPLLKLVKTLKRAFVILLVAFIILIGAQLLGIGSLSFVPLSIVGGSMLAIALHTEKGFRLVNQVLGYRWSVVAVIVLIVLARYFNAPAYIIHILLVMLVGSCVIREDHLLSSVLSNKWISYIGTISYGMYMFNMLCLNMAVKLLNFSRFKTSAGFEVFILTLLLTVIIASISFKYYESYFLKLKRRHER